MTVLTWSDELALAHPQMDQTHEEFIDLLADARVRLDGEPAALLQAFEALTTHTVAHFAQEDRWMAATGFAAGNCHAFQHQAVLAVMTECVKRARDGGDFEPLRLAVAELATWFPQHARSMDAGLAQHLAAVGFDPATGTCARPPAEAGLTSCGSGSCG